jgi:hypothetical protein
MPSRNDSVKTYRFRPAFALVNAALLLLLSGAAQAQMTRTRPQTATRSDADANTDSQPTHSNDNTHSQAARSNSKPSTSTERSTESKDYDYDVRQDSRARAVSRSGKVDFGVLFPTAKRGGVSGAAAQNRLPGAIVFGGDIFDGIDFPKPPPDSNPSRTNDTTVKRSARSTGTETTAYDRYKQSQEASASTKPAHAACDRSQIFWPYYDRSPFWGYSPDEVFRWPGAFPGDPGSDDWVVLGWPNYELQESASRDEPPCDYRMGERRRQGR